MPDRFFNLPKDLQNLIFEFDPTRRKKMDEALVEMKTNLEIMKGLTHIAWSDDPFYIMLKLKRMVRRYKKTELKRVAYFIKCNKRLPKHYTKKKLLEILFIESLKEV